MKSVKDLRPADYNPRKITDKQLLMLDEAMKKFGDLSGIVFNRQTGNLVGGHQRVKCLNPEWEIVKEECEKDSVGTVAFGYIETPYGRWVYREVDWPSEIEMIANIAANNQGGENDMAMLKDILEELANNEAGPSLTALELTGFNESELKKLLLAEDGEDKKNDIKVEIITIIIDPEQWITTRQEIKDYLQKLIDEYGVTIKYDE